MSATAARWLEPVPLDGGGSLQIEINGIQRHLLVEHGLDPAVPDNRIIGAALGQADHGPHHHGVERRRAADQGGPPRGAMPPSIGSLERDVGTTASGWTTIETSHEVVDALYAGDGVEVHDDDDWAGVGQNEFAVLRSGSQSALTRRVGPQLTLLSHSAPEAWGLRLDRRSSALRSSCCSTRRSRSLRSTGERGPARPLLAVAAGLEQVVETARYEKLAVYRPLVPVGRADVGFLPAASTRSSTRGWPPSTTPSWR